MKTIILSISLVAIVCSSPILGQAKDNNVAAPLELSATIHMINITGRIGHLAYNSKQQVLYVAAFSNNTLEVIDLQNKKKIHSIKALVQPNEIALIPNTDMLFVACLGDGLCKGFNSNTYAETRTQNVGSMVNTVKYGPTLQQLYVGYGEGAIVVYDANTIKMKSTIKLPAHPESFQIDENSGTLFVNIPKTHQVEVIDIKNNVIKKTWNIDGAAENYPMALDKANHRLFIGCRNPAKLVVLDSETGNKIASVDIDGEANDIFFNDSTKQIYVCCGAGYIDIIKQNIKEIKQVIKQQTKPVAQNKKGVKQQQPAKQETKLVKQDTYDAISKIYTSDGARTALLIPELNQLIVAAPAAAGKDAQLMVYHIK